MAKLCPYENESLLLTPPSALKDGSNAEDKVPHGDKDSVALIKCTTSVVPNAGGSELCPVKGVGPARLWHIKREASSKKLLGTTAPGS